MEVSNNLFLENKVDAPSYIFNWLTEVKKLSVAFRKVYSSFAVRVISEKIDHLSDIERQILRTDIAYVRQVFLLGDNIPQVYARVAVPLPVYVKNKRKFDTLRTQPIGETLLYCNPSITRSEFEYSSMSVASLPFYQNEIDKILLRDYYQIHKDTLLNTKLWSRTSSFFEHNQMYLAITETFFPTIVPSDQENYVSVKDSHTIQVKNGILEYDEETSCVIAHFLGYMTSKEFRSFLNEGLKLCIKHKQKGKPIYWLADTRNHSIQSKEDTDWVAHNWNIRALSIGIKHVAFVLPENLFGELSIKNYVKESDRIAEDHMVSATFETIDKAKTWFKQLSIKAGNVEKIL
ncbi:MAG: chorismate lyase [Bacteroidota bacterium]